MYGLDNLPPCDVEPHVFYEPRPAVAPFAVMMVRDRDISNDFEYWDGPHDTRELAEEAARRCANALPKDAFYVVGCVSITSIPNPVKASTRSLV